MGSFDKYPLFDLSGNRREYFLLESRNSVFLMSLAPKKWERYLILELEVGQQTRKQQQKTHLSYTLNSLKGGYIEDSIGDYYRAY